LHERRIAELREVSELAVEARGVFAGEPRLAVRDDDPGVDERLESLCSRAVGDDGECTAVERFEQLTVRRRWLADDDRTAPRLQEVDVAVGGWEQLERRPKAPAWRVAGSRRRTRRFVHWGLRMADSGATGSSRISMFTGDHLPSSLRRGLRFGRNTG
jgi:hypothetical protein